MVEEDIFVVVVPFFVVGLITQEKHTHIEKNTIIR